MHSKTAVSNAKQHSYPVTDEGEGCLTVKAPGGYKFTLVDQDVIGGKFLLQVLHGYCLKKK